MRHTTYKIHNNRTNTHTHTCHRQVNLLSDRSSTQSFTCATRLTDCKIHTRNRQSTHTHTHATVSHVSLRSIFNAISHRSQIHNIHMRSIFNAITTTRLTDCKIHTRNRNKATHTHTHTPSGQSSLRSIFNAIIHMRHTTYPLQNTHAIENAHTTHTHTHTHTHTCHRQVNLLSDRSSTQSFTCATRHTHTTHMCVSSGQSSLRSIFNAIIQHTHNRLTHTHTAPSMSHIRCNHSQHTKQTHTQHTHTHATVRSIFSQIDLQRNHSHAPHDLLPAKYTRNRNNTHTHTHTHATVRSIFSQIDLQRNHSHAPHTLTFSHCKIHTQ